MGYVSNDDRLEMLARRINVMTKRSARPAVAEFDREEHLIRVEQDGTPFEIMVNSNDNYQIFELDPERRVNVENHGSTYFIQGVVSFFAE